MRPDDLFTWLKAAPFQPFRIHLNGGRICEIRHPEMMKVGRTTAHVFHYAGAPHDPYERVEMVSLLLMERIEAMEGAAKPSGNGQQGNTPGGT